MLWCDSLKPVCGIESQFHQEQTVTLGKLLTLFPLLWNMVVHITSLLRVAGKIKLILVWEVFSIWHIMSSKYVFLVIIVSAVSVTFHGTCYVSTYKWLPIKWHSKSLVLKDQVMVIISTPSLVKLEKDVYNMTYSVFSCKRAKSYLLNWVVCPYTAQQFAWPMEGAVYLIHLTYFDLSFYYQKHGVELLTLNLGVVSSGPMLGVELTF